MRSGDFRSWHHSDFAGVVALCPLFGVDRKWLAEGQTAALTQQRHWRCTAALPVGQEMVRLSDEKRKRPL